MVVAEVTGIVDMKLVVVFVDGAERIGDVAVVFGDPPIDSTGGHAGGGHGFAADKVGDIGLMDQEVGRDAAGIVPIKTPLIEALEIEVVGGSAFLEAGPIGIGWSSVGRN